jgi:AcrR family transcriptional regulator
VGRVLQQSPLYERKSANSYHHGNLSNALLRAGLDMLEKRGACADLGLREVAREVGVSPAAVYRHYASKEALLTALAIDGFRRLTEAQMAPVAGKIVTPVRFADMGRAYVRFAVKNPALFRLMFSDQIDSSRDAALMFATEQLTSNIEDAVARLAGPRFSSAMRRKAALRAWSLVHGLSLLLIDGQMRIAHSEIDRMIEAVVDPSHALSI